MKGFSAIHESWINFYLWAGGQIKEFTEIVYDQYDQVEDIGHRNLFIASSQSHLD